ncbi:GH25 family lysozyme [Bacillus spongiae]|uniref:GH25 family lysozyme n=1 Tax=Bacillus spongiae TaxID=2683610 RepID=A0ABU8HJ60_9BACI
MKIKGIDVSHWQGNINWDKVQKDGVKFAFIKATQGTSYSKVHYFKDNAKKAVKEGIHVGAYHYATFSSVSEAIKEAKYFLSVVKGFKLDYPLVLDLEEDKKGVSKKQLTDGAIAFLEVLENGGHFAMLYTGKSFLENQLDEKRLKPYALWVARYNYELGRHADIWQHTSSGRVNGISGNVDMNWSYRDFAAEIRKMRNTKPTKIATPKKETVYIVKPGDNLTKVANKYNTSVDKLVRDNKIKNKNLIYPGQKIRIK